MIYDLAIIGGGPAGLMAANRAGELGAKVIIIEKNNQPGAKLLLTGNGRCNLTNKIDDHKILAGHYGKNGKFLLSGFNQFDVHDTINFFETRGVKTKIEDHDRVLPKSDRAHDVLAALLGDLRKYQVKIKNNSRVSKIITQDQKIKKIILSTGEEILAKNYLLAVGGKSYPLTGSTGDGYLWLKKLGHTIIDPLPILTPLILQEKYIFDLEGLSIKNASLTAKQQNQIIGRETGDLIFTAQGLSGPAILNLSRLIANRANKKISIAIDFLPLKSEQQLETDFITAWNSQKNKTIKNSLAAWLPAKLISVILDLAGVAADKQTNSITRTERKKIVSMIKEFKTELDRLDGYDRAMITGGGVKLSEVDPKTMRSKLINNLYLAGEILDLDGPTGGFNLQVCWTTGYVAGTHAV